jgi:hypothetical protein
MVTNGARFASNFTIAPANGGSTTFSLAASGNDIVATTGDIHTVAFNLNGGVGTVPASILVVSGARLGELVMPSADYVNADNFKSDGLWYTTNGRVGVDWIISDEFKFTTGNTGTSVTRDMTLVLDWTDIIVSVAQTDRVVPGNSDAEASVIAPIVVIGGEIIAGPNTVSKSGTVNLFRIGRSIQNGKLAVYDASGNKVKTIKVSDKSTNSTDKRIVGTWDLTDAKGRPVSEGAYLINGIVTTRDGKREKVSVIVSVR